MNLQGKRAVGLLRMSTTEQVSLDKQETTYLEFCDRHGLINVRTWKITGSASETKVHQFLANMRQHTSAYDELEHMWDADEFDVLWAIDKKRLGRSRGVFNHVVENTAKRYNKLVFIGDDPEPITRANFDFKSLLHSFDLDSDIRRLHGPRAVGTMINKASDGIAPMKALWAYEKVWDGGQAIGVRFKESTRPLLSLATRLLLDGYSYKDIADQTIAQGYIQYMVNGSRVRRTFFHPMLHGHISYGGATKYNTWVFDPGEPLPEGVTIRRNVIPPFWEPDIHQQVKANLISRTKSKYAHQSHGMKNPYRGIAYCASCGGRMAYDSYQQGNRPRYTYLRCSRRCGARTTRLDLINSFMDAVIREAVKRGIVVLNTDNHALDNWQTRLNNIEQRIKKLEGTIQNLYLDRATSRASLIDPIIRKQEHALETLESEYRVLLNRKPLNPVIQQQALEEINRLSIDGLWSLPPRDFNRHLKALLGNTKILLDGQQFKLSG